MPTWTQEELDRIEDMKTAAAEEATDAVEGAGQIGPVLDAAKADDAIYEKVAQEAYDEVVAKLTELKDAQPIETTGTFASSTEALYDEINPLLLIGHIVTITLSGGWTSVVTVDGVFEDGEYVAGAIVPGVNLKPGLTYAYTAPNVITATEVGGVPPGIPTSGTYSSTVEYTVTYNTLSSEWWDYTLYTDYTDPTREARKTTESNAFPSIQSAQEWDSATQTEGPLSEMDVRENMQEGGWFINFLGADGDPGVVAYTYNTLDQADKDYIDERQTKLSGTYLVRENIDSGTRLLPANLEFAQKDATAQADFAVAKGDYLAAL